MTTLEFGAWGSVKHYDIEEQYGGVAAGAYDDHIRQAQLMDDLGYKYYWIIEHQASYVGAITAPSPAAARTTSTKRALRLRRTTARATEKTTAKALATAPENLLAEPWVVASGRPCVPYTA